jgi:hypothetical protein
MYEEEFWAESDVMQKHKTLITNPMTELCREIIS